MPLRLNRAPLPGRLGFRGVGCVAQRSSLCFGTMLSTDQWCATVNANHGHRNLKAIEKATFQRARPVLRQRRSVYLQSFLTFSFGRTPKCQPKLQVKCIGKSPCLPATYHLPLFLSWLKRLNSKMTCFSTSFLYCYSCAPFDDIILVLLQQL